jgi:hypothetical protein
MEVTWNLAFEIIIPVCDVLVMLDLILEIFYDIDLLELFLFYF